MDYPLYDVPYLVREPNDAYMSSMRHNTEVITDGENIVF